ncbi:hypothetical protein [Poseidonibacter ostreae]|uniref:hypothetical protein n=1 Tax=Poseidonibacter ostreae TaxID=2654171 RepID=UPI001265500B|nr:hypothetical protein [Poseidonibacter ostreae]
MKIYYDYLKENNKIELEKIKEKNKRMRDGAIIVVGIIGIIAILFAFCDCYKKYEENYMIKVEKISIPDKISEKSSRNGN